MAPYVSILFVPTGIAAAVSVLFRPGRRPNPWQLRALERLVRRHEGCRRIRDHGAHDSGPGRPGRNHSADCARGRAPRSTTAPQDAAGALTGRHCCIERAQLSLTEGSSVSGGSGRQGTERAGEGRQVPEHGRAFEGRRVDVADLPVVHVPVGRAVTQGRCAWRRSCSTALMVVWASCLRNDQWA